MTNYLDNLRKKATDTVRKLRGRVDATVEEVKEKGVGDYLHERAADAAEGAGRLYAKVEKAVSPETSTADPATYGQQARDAVDKGIIAARQRGSELSDLVRKSSTKAREIASGVKHTIDDYAVATDRVIVLGEGTKYTVNSWSKEEIAKVDAYLKQTQTIPTETEGLPEVREFIAAHAITSTEGLTSTWQREKLPNCPALDYLMQK